MIRARTPTRTSEGFLVGILALEGVLGLAGGAMLVADPSGGLLQMPLAWLASTPFATFLIPGVLLGVALGLLPLFAAYALARPRRMPRLRRLEVSLGMDTAWLATFASGVGIMIWIIVQIAMVRMFHPMQAFIFGLGAAIVALALVPATRRAHRPRPW